MHRKIEISVVLNGYIATVGCQTVVWQHAEEMIAALRGVSGETSGDREG